MSSPRNRRVRNRRTLNSIKDVYVLTLVSTISRFSVSIAAIAAMTMLSATQLQKGWATLKHSDAPVVLAAELAVIEAGTFTLGAFFKMVKRWPEHPLYYPTLETQIPTYIVLALATLALFYKRGIVMREILFAGALFGVAAV